MPREAYIAIDWGAAPPTRPVDVVYCHMANAHVRDEALRLNPRCQVYAYCLAPSTRTDAAVDDGTNVAVGYQRARELGWLAKDASGLELSVGSASGVERLLDLRSASAKQAWLDGVGRKLASSQKWAGLYLDNVLTTTRTALAWHAATGVGLPSWLAVDAEWSGLVADWVAAARALADRAGKRLHGNLCPVRDGAGRHGFAIASLLHGALDEFAWPSEADGGPGVTSASYAPWLWSWRATLHRHRWLCRAGVDHVWRCRSTDARQVAFSLASYLLGWQAGYGCFALAPTYGRQEADVLGPARALGGATGPAREHQDGTWTRAFERGVVVVNPQLQAVGAIGPLSATIGAAA